MIGIKQHEKNWRLEIKEERWQFPNKETAMAILNYMVDLKAKYGSLRKKND